MLNMECFTDRTLCRGPAFFRCVRPRAAEALRARGPALLACAARLGARVPQEHPAHFGAVSGRRGGAPGRPGRRRARHAAVGSGRRVVGGEARRRRFGAALRDDAGPRLRDAALRQLASSDVLDAVIAKASAARNGVSSRVSTDLVPAVCRCVASKTCALATRVTAHKALAAALDRPPATPPEVMRVVLPALRDSVRLVHGQPALAMCVLGASTSSLKITGAVAHLENVLPSLIPLLDEKALNARQFDMVAGRVEAMLASAIQARRGELDSPSSVQPRLSAPDPFRATPSPPAAAPAPVPGRRRRRRTSTAARARRTRRTTTLVLAPCPATRSRSRRQPRPGAGRADPEAAQAAGAGAAPPRAARARPAEAAGRRLAAARVQQRRRREAHGAARRGGPLRRRQRPVRFLWRRFAGVRRRARPWTPSRPWVSSETRRGHGRRDERADASMGGMPPAPPGADRDAGMSAAAPASSAFDFATWGASVCSNRMASSYSSSRRVVTSADGSTVQAGTGLGG